MQAVIRKIPSEQISPPFNAFTFKEWDLFVLVNIEDKIEKIKIFKKVLTKKKT